MSRKVSDLMRGRLQNNAVKFTPGTRDGLMISGGGFQGKTETACEAAAEFEDLWRDIHRQLAPGPVPGTRDLFVPVAYCRLPVKATPKALCKTILDIYGDPHPATLHDLVRSVRDAVRDHATTALADRRHHQAQAAPRRRPGHPGPDPRADGPRRHPRADRRRHPRLRAARQRPPRPAAGQWVFPAAPSQRRGRHPDRPAVRPGRPRPVRLLHPGRDHRVHRAPGRHRGPAPPPARPPTACSPPATCPSTCSAAPTASSACSAASSRTAAPRRSPPARNASPRTAGRHRHPPGQPRRPRPEAARSPTIPEDVAPPAAAGASAGPATPSSTTTAAGRPPMSDPAIPGSRPLARSLDPLAGESLGGYLLRLSYRLCASAPSSSPASTGCAEAAPASSAAPAARPRHGCLRPGRPAQPGRGRRPDAGALGRPLPAHRAGTDAASDAGRLLAVHRTSPATARSCLAGDGSPVQQQHGGPWKTGLAPADHLRLP